MLLCRTTRPTSYFPAFVLKPVQKAAQEHSFSFIHFFQFSLLFLTALFSLYCRMTVMFAEKNDTGPDVINQGVAGN